MVYENGQAFVYAGGEKLATNYEVGIPSPALATMWHHKDPNMSNYRSTGPSGTVLGTGVDNHDWDKIETDGDGKSVGLSAPVYFPEHSNELYTSGWSFGSLNTGQYLLNNIEGLHVPPEYNQGGSQWDGWRFGILFRRTEVQSHQIRILSRTTIRPTGTGVGIRMQNEDGTWPSADWASTSESYAIETTVFMVVNATRAINWSLIPQINRGRPLSPGEQRGFDAARDRAREVLKNRSKCRSAVARLLKEVGIPPLMPDTVLVHRDGTTTTVSTIDDFVYNPLMQSGQGGSSFLDLYDETTILASGVSGRKGRLTQYGIAYRDFVNGILQPITVAWNREFFSLSLDARALHVLHEILHMYASDIELANRIRAIDRDSRTSAFTDTDLASNYVNQYLQRHCNLPVE